MKRLSLILIVVFISITSFCQVSKGVYFEHNLSWDEIVQKANKEHKYIFVDCYATWCGPCKVMTDSVFTNDKLGNYMNENFLSVKLQMDTSSMDNDQIKSWRAKASEFQKVFHISILPTYLFFSAEGKAVHKDIGLMDARDFQLNVANSALNRTTQYYFKIKHYRELGLTSTQVLDLAQHASEIGDYADACNIARDEVNNHLLRRASDVNKATLDTVARFYKFLNITDRPFELAWRQPQLINRIMGKGYAESSMDYFIYKFYYSELIENSMHSGKRPIFDNIQRMITNRYGYHRGEVTTIRAKVIWYQYKKDWNSYLKFLLIQIKNSPSNNAMALNNNAYEIFKYSSKSSQLKEGLKLANSAINNINGSDAGLLAALTDTKANIVYKMGMKREAIQLETEVLKLVSSDSAAVNFFNPVLAKMKKGIPTWPETKEQ